MEDGTYIYLDIYPSHPRPPSFLRDSQLSLAPLLELLEDLDEEVLEAEGDVAVAVLVVLLEDVGHALEGDAGLDEEVEAHDPFAALVVGAEEQVDEALAEAVPEGDQSITELVGADVAAAVGVEAVEERPPRRQERPQPAELLEPDRTRPVAVEHPDHHPHRLRVERRPVPVHQRRRQLLLRQLARACFQLGLAFLFF